MNDYNTGTEKIDRLISDHFMRLMNSSEVEDMNDYVLSPDPDQDSLFDPRTIEAPSVLTPVQSPAIRRTQSESTVSREVSKPVLELTIKESFSLDPYSFKLFLFLNVVTEAHDCCQASLAVLADGSGLARESCRKALRSLEHQGYVQLVKRDQKRGNIYRVKKVL